MGLPPARDRDAAAGYEAGRVCGLVLASGLSRRFGNANKLLERIEGRTIIERTVYAYREALSEVYVVVGHDAGRVRGALHSLDVKFVENANYEAGQSSAVRMGIRALLPDTAAAVMGVGDQPLLNSGIIDTLVSRWATHPSEALVPLYGGAPGNPVLVDRALFAELQDVAGDIGGRDVIRRRGFDGVPVAPPWAALDVDTPEDMALVEQYLRGPSRGHAPNVDN